MKGLLEAVHRVEDVLDGFSNDTALMALIMVMMECIAGDEEIRRKMIRALCSFPCPGEVSDGQMELFEAVEYSMSTRH